MGKTGNSSNIGLGPCAYVIAIAVLFVCAPLYQPGLQDGHDLVFHYNRYLGAFNALAAGQWPPLIDPGGAKGFGYNWNGFYAPLSTYAFCLLRVFFSDGVFCIKVMIAGMTALAGLGMFLLAREFAKSEKAATVAAICYVAAPYHLLNSTIRQAQGEVFAAAFLPFLFLGLHRALHGGRKKIALMTLGGAGLVLSHNLTAFMASLFALLYLAMHWRKAISREALTSAAASAASIALICLFYLAPLVENRLSANYIAFNPDLMLTSPRHMAEHAVDWSRLFADSLFKQYLDDGLLLSPRIPLAVGLHFLFALAAAPFVIARANEECKNGLRAFFALGALALLLTSTWIPWATLPSAFSIVQFPWRYLSMASFFLSLGAGVAITMMFRRFGPLQALFATFVVLALVSPYVGFANYANKKTSAEIPIDLPPAEYRPVLLTDDYLRTRGKDIVVLSGDARARVVARAPNRIDFRVEFARDATLELPFLYYPGYELEFGAKKIPAFQTEHGMVGVFVGNAKDTTAKVSFSPTTLTRTSSWISLSALLAFAGWWAFRRFARRVQRRMDLSYPPPPTT